MCIALSAGAVVYTDCIKHIPKQSDGEVSVMLDLLGMRSTPS